ncbi:acetyl/propionyl/methylcrotonyl-CoA carboxylase subunit alpha [Neobacillus mesonae]|uniref:acetyl-CoA carboxylase biotin carboxylase subunit n=1 Tax=Neobacillus mesonae TaxID=1193713 RepID=UPI00203B938D|nr:acetyl-CoA carboxylase biotin carboxylase subunit [Neobacillus mesonae]MCM3568087.1 acetyl-CoA carboxylase biotin carboxylase subunit [Neobacillus mesonae]
MFTKILIANRGEIAARIIRTCKKMGIKTVAIYSEADINSPHVEMADESYLIGPPRVNESYLKMEKIMEVALQANVDAIHPGYGLLSENPEFSKKCAENNIVFIGPSPSTISQMGSKIEARKLMSHAGVPIVPGTDAPLADVEEAVREAKNIGYPIMLKASAGGGGIGMQRVDDEEGLRRAFQGNQKRAKDFFGDGAMFLEKLILNPRHIEIQLLADKEGNTVYLGERECSIQRRHQKVIEEAPSPFIDELTRKEMGGAAVRAAQAIGYENAGTVEFIMDEHKNFYFLEVNTRLQVEHPVTEEVTGLDLVEQQIRIANGETLTISQKDVQLNGHAIEVRIYAEDPNTFFPSPGTITSFSIPSGENIRHELAVGQGSVVTPFYDPMIAKLIVKGLTRNEAIKSMGKVLEQYKVEGIKTNIPTLKRIVNHPEYISGNTTTSFIDSYLKTAKVN